MAHRSHPRRVCFIASSVPLVALAALTLGMSAAPPAVYDPLAIAPDFTPKIVDLVVTDGGEGQIEIHDQIAPGAFAATPRSVPVDAVEHVECADLDADGNLDFVCAATQASEIRLIYQRSPGVFDPAVVLGGPGVTVFPIGLAVADLDVERRGLAR